MGFEYGTARMKKMVETYPFLKPFDREVSKSLIDDLEKEIVKLTKMVTDLKKIKTSYGSDGKLIPQVRSQIVFLNAKKDVISEYLLYVKKKYSYSQRKDIEIKEEEFLLNDRQCLLLGHIIAHGLNPNIKVKDLSDIYLFLLDRLYKVDLLNDIAIHLVDLANNRSGDLGDFLYLLVKKLREKTNKKIHTLAKEDPDRIKLKQILKVFELENEPVEDNKHDYRLDVIDFWLNDGKSYIYLKRLTELMPEVVNMKCEGKPIIFTILDYYFNSCLVELKNQTKDYIQKEYYGEVFKLFFNNPNFDLSNVDEILTKIEDFKEQIKRYKKSPTVMKCLSNLCKRDEDEKPIEKVDCDYIKYIYESAIRRPNRRDLSSLYTFSIVGEKSKYINKCYSAQIDDKGRIVIAIHTIDMSEFVDKDSLLDKYLKFQMFKNGEDLLPSIASLSFEKGVKRPTITYEITLSENGRICSYDIFKSIVSLDDIFTYQNFTFPNETIKASYHTLFHDFDLDKTNVSQNMEYMYLSKASRAVGTYFNKRNLPCIYRVQKEQDSSEFVKNMNALSSVMGKMDRKTAHIIYEIICEDHNTSFYDQVNIGHASFKQPYFLDLFNPLDSYVTLTLQRLVNDFYIRDDSYNIDLWQQELADVINRANTIKTKNKEQSKRKTRLFVK